MVNALRNGSRIAKVMTAADLKGIVGRNCEECLERRWDGKYYPFIVMGSYIEFRCFLCNRLLPVSVSSGILAGSEAAELLREGAADPGEGGQPGGVGMGSTIVAEVVAAMQRQAN